MAIYLEFYDARQEIPVDSQDGEQYIVYDEDGIVWLGIWDADKQEFYDEDAVDRTIINPTFWFRPPKITALAANYGKES